MKIIDSCVHYWESPRPDRPWDPKGIDLGPIHLVEHVLAEAAKAGVDQIVQVTPTILGEDNRYSIECARRYPDRVYGVFGRFDPTAPGLSERLAEFAQPPEILGLRLWLMRDDQVAWLHDGTLDRLLEEVPRHRLLIAIYAPWHAKELGEVVRRHPQTNVLVDHMTLRFSDEDPFKAWKDVLDLAAVPNLWIKVSVFPEVSHEAFPFRDVLPRVREMYEAFGADRLIWGSNFPPSTRKCSYADNLRFFKEIPFISDGDKEKIFSRTLLDVVSRMGKPR